MSIERKVQEALALGVPMKDINRVLQSNAMKSRDPNVRSQLMNAGGAVYKQVGGSVGNVYAQNQAAAKAARDAQQKGTMLQGGLKTIGNVQSNLAAGIGQAGLNNQAFAPTSSLGTIGDTAQAQGLLEAQYQGDTANIARQQFQDEARNIQERTRRSERSEDNFIKVRDRLNKEKSGIVEGIKLQEDFIGKATIIVDALNQITETDWSKFVEAGTLNNEGFDEWLRTRGIKGSVLVASGDSSSTQSAELIKVALADAKEKAVLRADISQPAKVAIGRITSVLTQMADVRLQIHPGVKTNFDFEKAQEGISNISLPYASFKNNIVSERALAVQKTDELRGEINAIDQDIAAEKSKVIDAPDVNVDFKYTDLQTPEQQQSFNKGGEVEPKAAPDAEFSGEYNGMEYDFVPHTGELANDVKFYESKAEPGNVIASRDGYLYAKGETGWYRSYAKYRR